MYTLWRFIITPRPKYSMSDDLRQASGPQKTVEQATHDALHEQDLRSKPKSWLARGITSLMQLPNQTPLTVLRFTTPEGPMPSIMELPSRDVGRTISVYAWIPGESAVFDGQADRPCVIDFHGGGFHMGGPLEQAPWCAALARSGIIALSVHYRQGPDWRFPAALLDAEDVLDAVLQPDSPRGQYIRSHVQRQTDGRIRGPDVDRVAVSGFSSGGNVALNMLLSIPSELLHQSKDWHTPFARSSIKQIPALLFFPSLDARQAPFERSRPEGLAPPGGVSKWIGRTLVDAYLPRHLVDHLRASPGLAPVGGVDGGDCMHPATRAVLILPQLDSLSEQSEVWVDALRAADKLIESPEDDGSMIGQPLLSQPKACVRVHRIKAMTHGFTTYPDSFIDEKTRAAKALVMEQARQFVVNMWTR